MIEGFEPVVVDTLGGLCTLLERSDLPVGLSPLAKNVRFFPGGVQSRGGFVEYLTDTFDTAPFDGYWGVYDFVDGANIRQHAVFQGGEGQVRLRPQNWATVAPPTPAIIKTGWVSPFSTMKAATLYGKAYICLSDGKRGLMPPFQIGSQAISRNVAMSGGHEATLTPGVGAMLAGRYFVVIAFENDTGFISSSVKLNYTTLGAPASIALSSVPIGPLGTVRRRIFISLVDSFDLYNPPGLVINDNTTTTFASINLTQAQIAAGLPFTSYINLRPPTAQLGVVAYNNRIAYWGGDGRVESFFGPTTTAINPIYSSIGLINLDFSSDDAASYAWGVPGEYGEWYGGSASASVLTGTSNQGELSNYLKLVSSGGATDALIQQGYGAAFVTQRPNADQLGNYFLQPSHLYGIRIRARRSATAVAGNLAVRLYEHTGLGARTTLTSANFPVTSMGTDWAIYELGGSTAPTGLPNISMDVYLSNVTNAAYVEVSHIEVYDHEYKRGTSTMLFSRVDDPESIDRVTGTMLVNQNDGQEIRSAFVLNGNLYIAKTDSLYVVTDNGQEPVFWNVERRSETVGTLSVHGAAVGDNFAVIAGRDGLYLLTGGAPEKISHEIQPTWELFDWRYGERMFVAIDTSEKRIAIGGPTATGFQLLQLDYTGGFGDPLSSGGEGRKWSTDTRFTGGTETGAFTSAGPLILDSGVHTIGYTIADDATRVAVEDFSTKSDYSGNIQSYYETAPIGTDVARSLFGQITNKIRGSGSLLSWFVRPDGTTTALPTKTLGAAPLHDVEIRTQNTDTQLGLRIGTYGTGHYFIAKRLAVWRKKAPFSFLRGY